MKLTVLVFLIIGVLSLAWMGDSADCPITCPNVWKSQCGRERRPDGTWKYATFKNTCYIIMQNTCFGGNYELCIN